MIWHTSTFDTVLFAIAFGEIGEGFVSIFPSHPSHWGMNIGVW